MKIMAKLSKFIKRIILKGFSSKPLLAVRIVRALSLAININKIEIPIRMKLGGKNDFHLIKLQFPAYDSIIVNSLIEYGSWDPVAIDVLVKRLCPDSKYALVDIGANIGIFSIQFVNEAMRAGHKIEQIACVEPVSNIFECLSFNMKSAGLAHANLLNFALSNHIGSIDIFVEKSNAGNNSLLKGSVYSLDFDTEKVSAAPLANILDWSKQTERLVLKIDVQGYEPQALEGIEDTLWCRVDLLFIEITPALYADCPASVLDRFAKRLGAFDEYVMVPDAGGGAVRVEKDDLMLWILEPEMKYFNLLAFRKSTGTGSAI